VLCARGEGVTGGLGGDMGTTERCVGGALRLDYVACALTPLPELVGAPVAVAQRGGHHEQS
jgi:hypothetical protein